MKSKNVFSPKFILFSLLALSSAGLPFSSQALTESDGVPHLEMELTGPEYRAIFDQMGGLPRARTRDPLRAVLEMGKRNLDYLTHINSLRSADQRLALTTAETQRAYPVEAPKENSRSLVLAQNDQLKLDLPAAMEGILYEGAAFSDSPPLSDAEYIAFARRANGIYESASRWLLQEPYLAQYRLRAAGDVRGYYFLAREPDLAPKLEQFSSLSAADQTRLKTNLLGLCVNSHFTYDQCVREFESQLQSTGKATAFYNKYIGDGKQNYDQYFAIQNARTDVEWNSTHPDEFRVPFLAPATAEISDFVRTNIEDEWKWNAWQLRIDFKAQGRGLTRVVFSPGVTPHVNGLGGNEITMDSNVPLSDYNVQWTIRHEYGHTLGFPDCYVEFYDGQREVMVNYQIDTTNLMCSRRGHIKQEHYDELKRAYYKF